MPLYVGVEVYFVAAVVVWMNAHQHPAFSLLPFPTLTFFL
jgi:hypothetical protein